MWRQLRKNLGLKIFREGTKDNAKEKRYSKLYPQWRVVGLSKWYGAEVEQTVKIKSYSVSSKKKRNLKLVRVSERLNENDDLLAMAVLLLIAIFVIALTFSWL
jgi:hypothetical protein